MGLRIAGGGSSTRSLASLMPAQMKANCAECEGEREREEDRGIDSERQTERDREAERVTMGEKGRRNGKISDENHDQYVAKCITSISFNGACRLQHT